MTLPGNTISPVVSTTYRLYYIDWDDKYKDGIGTIYLKADCTSNGYSIGTTGYSEETSKITTLNPSLYADGITPPPATITSMRAVSWLLDPNLWNSLKSSTMSTYVNYVIGAPSLELMMDSYNIHYDLTNTEPDVSGEFSSSNRTRLFYRYTSGGVGYEVGPFKDADFDYWTSDRTLASDPKIDSLYYPGDSHYYWIASPVGRGAGGLFTATCSAGGRISHYGYTGSSTYTISLCPVASIKPSALLELAD